MRRPDGQKERNFGPRFRRRKAGSKTPAQFLTKRTEHSALGVIAEWWGAPTNVCEIGALFHVNLLGLSAKTSDSSCSAGVLDIYIAFSFQTQRNWFMLNTHTHTKKEKKRSKANKIQNWGRENDRKCWSDMKGNFKDLHSSKQKRQVGRKPGSHSKLNWEGTSWTFWHWSGARRQELESQAVEGGWDPGRKWVGCEQGSSWWGQMEKETLEKYRWGRKSLTP